MRINKQGFNVPNLAFILHDPKVRPALNARKFIRNQKLPKLIERRKFKSAPLRLLNIRSRIHTPVTYNASAVIICNNIFDFVSHKIDIVLVDAENI